MTWILIGAGAVLVLLVGPFAYLSAILAWEDQRTVGLAYYGLPPGERAAFKEKLAGHARRLTPILRLLGRTSTFTFEKASFETRGLKGPRGTCSEASFETAFDYEARPEDVFVATQMKCGTTWMQHVVYETLCRGGGDLVETGTALYAVSPWLEARKSVPVEEAPLVGEERPSRVLKTHLPITHIPTSPVARYIYVARHPVSCFASSVDFIRSNAGPIQPSDEALERWFTSDDMWWGPWPAHVSGFWKAAEREPNVLFVRFEEMKRDLAAVVRRVAEFLGLRPLADEELARIVRKCGFDYMREHREAFEMHPPHLFAVDAELFVRGTADRHRDVPRETRARILDWCRREMEAAHVPLTRLYPEA